MADKPHKETDMYNPECGYDTDETGETVTCCHCKKSWPVEQTEDDPGEFFWIDNDGQLRECPNCLGE